MELTTPTVLFGDEARLQRLAEVGIEGTPMLSVDADGARRCPTSPSTKTTRS